MLQDNVTDIATTFIIQQVHVYMEGAKCCSESNTNFHN